MGEVQLDSSLLEPNLIRETVKWNAVELQHTSKLTELSRKEP